MDPNNHNPAEESKIAPGYVRCSALTRAGAPCKNLAIADGLCWMHGGRKKKSPSEDKTISETGPVLAEVVSLPVQRKIDTQTPGGDVEAAAGGEPPDGGISEAIEISEADIELISDGETPEVLPEAASALPLEAGQPEVAGPDEPAEMETAAIGDGELEILMDDALPDEALSEDGMDLGIELDAGEPVAEEAEEHLQLLQGDELPEEEIEGAIEFDADSLGLEVADETDGAGPESDLQQGLELETWGDEPDKEPTDEEASDATIEIPDISLDIQDGSEEKESEVSLPEIDPEVEAEFGDLELELLPDDELPAEEIEAEFVHPADKRESTDSDRSTDKVPAVEDEDVLLEMLPDADSASDAADMEISLDDGVILGPEEAAIVSGPETEPEPGDDRLGETDVNRFGTAAGKPEFSDVPKFAVPKSQAPRRRFPETFYPRQLDVDSDDAAEGYKTRTTIGKFQEMPFDTLRRDELKRIKERRLPPKKTESFWRRRVGIPAPIFWGATWLLLILGGISALHYGLGVHIPYVSGLMPPMVKDAGNLKITAYGTESRFVENIHSGTLLVITGRIRNDYPAPRRSIRVTGRLFTQNDFVKSLTVYCGEQISDEELGDLPAEAIQERLSGGFEDRGPKGIVTPRQTLPFMIVFSQLPDDLTSLEKFTVEVAGSSPAK